MDGKRILESAGGVGVSSSVAPSLEQPFFSPLGSNHLSVCLL